MNTQSAPTKQPDLLALGELVEQVSARLQNGERIDIDQLTLEFPEHADRLRKVLPMLQELNGLDWTMFHAGAVDDDLKTAEQPTLGDFRLLRQIGRGGMGVVYEAQQLSISRKVALKVLPLAALVDHRALQRFKNEVAAIATLEHPHIVSVYAIGEDRGIHYYAMQLIHGQSLAAVIRELRTRADSDKSLSGDVLNQVVSDMEDVDPVLEEKGSGLFCAQHPEGHSGKRVLTPFLTPFPDAETRARGRSSTLRQVGDQTYFRNVVRLILQAADALQHAHDHGIVHRDVKPGNLLLNTHGNLFVTDFGLARIQAGAGVTMTGDVMGTLRYMSPEQILGNRVVIDHRTDIYSLGATLYELLTLQPIWSGDDRAELLRQISFEEPTRPQKISPAIPTDLETIVLKAISKNPNDRYDSAQSFADDLSCFLDLKPIVAKRPTAIQRVAKWSRRNPTIMWSSAAILIVLAASLSVGIIGLAASNRMISDREKETAKQRQRAEDREQSAIDAVKTFSAAVVESPELKNNPSLDSLRKSLLKEPLEFFATLREQLNADQDTRPESLARLAFAASELGKLNKEIGNKEDSLRAFQESLGIWERLAQEHPNVSDYQLGLSASLMQTGELQRATGRVDAALDSFHQMLVVSENLSRNDPGNSKVQREMAVSLGCIGRVKERTGELQAALTSAQRSLAILGRLVEDNPDEILFQYDLAVTHFNIGEYLGKMGRYEAALESFQQALTLDERLTRELPEMIDYQASLGKTYKEIGGLQLRIGRKDAALESSQQALAIAGKLTRENPTVLAFQHSLAASHNLVGRIHKEMGRSDAALESLQKALTIGTQLVRDDPTDNQNAKNLAEDHRSIGQLHLMARNYEAAKNSFSQALPILEQQALENPELPDIASGLGALLHAMALIAVNSGEYDEGCLLLKQAIEWQKKAMSVNPLNPHYQECAINHLANLIIALEKTNDEAAIAAAQQQLNELEASDPKFATLDARLKEVLAGAVPNNPNESYDLAFRAYQKRDFASSVQLVRKVLQTYPELAENRSFPDFRYSGVCFAARAASQKTPILPLDEKSSESANGEQRKLANSVVPNLDDAARRVFRDQARLWLTEELACWNKLLESANNEQRAQILVTMEHLFADPDLKGIRDAEELGLLEESEKLLFQTLWTNVEDLRSRARKQ